MAANENYRLEMVPAQHVKQMSGLQNNVVHTKEIEKIRGFAKERGCCRPVVLSDSSDSMTLLAGAATFEVYIEEKIANIPAIIVKTDGDADNLMFMLQSAQLNETPCPIAISEAIVKLIDSYNVPRKHIATVLGKSSAWITRMESICRKLNVAVQAMVAKGQIPARSALEIARLPDEAQAIFAISVCNELLSKDIITQLVNRYLNEDSSADDRQMIISTPKLAITDGLKRRGKMRRGNSDDASFSHAATRCMDYANYLSRILDRIEIDKISIRMSDVMALSDALASLLKQIQAIFYPGKTDDNTNAILFAQDNEHTGTLIDGNATDELTSDLPAAASGPRRRRSGGVLTKKQQEKFDMFWEAYPNKKSIGQAEKTFAALDPDERLFQEIMC